MTPQLSRSDAPLKSNTQNKILGHFSNETRRNAIVEYLDYQIPVTQLKGPKRNGDMQAANRDLNTPPTGGRQI